MARSIGKHIGLYITVFVLPVVWLKAEQTKAQPAGKHTQLIGPINAAGESGDGDVCAECISIETGVPFDGSTVDASKSNLSSCDGSAENPDRWHCWTADCDGLATAGLCEGQTSYDTTISVFSECGTDALICDDDGCGNLRSEMHFEVMQGSQYFLRVAGHDGAQGDYTLTVSCTEGPRNDSCENATPIASGTTPFSTVNAATDGPTLPSECNEGFGTLVNRDVWFDYTAECTGLARFSTCDNAAFDTRLALYHDCDCPVNNTRLAGCNDDGPGCSLFTSVLEAFVEQDSCYKLRLGGFAEESGTGNVEVSCEPFHQACLNSNKECTSEHPEPGCMDTVCCTAVCDRNSSCCNDTWSDECTQAAQTICFPPPNDRCDDVHAERLPYTFTGNNTLASNDCNDFPGNEAWIAFVLLTPSAVRLDYCGSNPPFADSWLNLVTNCGCRERTYAAASCFLCPDGNVVMEWACLNAGIYYYPILTAPGSMGDYVINVESHPCMDNNDCVNANPIEDGFTLFTTVGALKDGPNLPNECDEGTGTIIHRDIWYDYTASCTGEAMFSTCSSADFDTWLALYDDTTCPVTNTRLLACNNDDDSCLGDTSRFSSPVTMGRPYKLRIGGLGQAQGNGCIYVECDDGSTNCPDGDIRFIDPPHGVVDARQPTTLTEPPILLGIDEFIVEAPPNADTECFVPCETDSGNFEPIRVVQVTTISEGRYRVQLNRPLTPGAVTTLTYRGSGGGTGTFTSHPANVNADLQTGPLDILAIIDILNGVQEPPWGLYSGDTNHSGQTSPQDILRVIDLLNGASVFKIWNGTPLPVNEGSCPD